MKTTDNPTQGRGREADRPREIPSRGWKDIAFRIKEEQSKDNLGIVAAGVAFYLILSIFPAIASAISIYGLVLDPNQISRQLDVVSGMLPQEAYQIIHDQLSHFVQQSGKLSLGVVIGILVTLWSANKGTKALIQSLNIVYDEKEKRGFFKLNLWSLLLTLGIILMTLIALGFLIAVPAVIGLIGLPETIRNILVYVRWPILALFVVVGLAVLYRFGPDRDQPRWRWVSLGSVLATILWIIGSVIFSYYVSNFGDYNKFYGSMGAVVILMMWFSLTSYVILLGGEINAEMEHQTQKDTTEGPSRPMGERQAYVADTVGPGHE